MESEMGIRNGSAKPDEEFVRAAWEHARDTEQLQRVVIAYELLPTNRAGVWCLTLLAQDLDAGVGFMKPLARYRTEFPGPQSAFLGAVLLQAIMKLDTMLLELRGRPSSAHKQK